MKTPEQVATTIFKILDTKGQGTISLEVLEAFLRKIFIAFPVEHALGTFPQECIRRLRDDGERLYKEVTAMSYEFGLHDGRENSHS